MSKFSSLNWAERFALADAYSPTDAEICNTFGVDADELATARELRQTGHFGVAKSFDTAGFGNPFVASTVAASEPVKTKVKATATVHTKVVDGSQPPETATKRVKVPQKRGRKGDKIQQALLAVPANPVSVDDFRKQHSVSLAVLRQSKRFISKMDKPIQDQIGEVMVRQDKNTRVLMIWRVSK